MDPSREPSADMREMAQMQFEWFNALCLEGFNEAQALTMLGTAIGVAIANNQKGRD